MEYQSISKEPNRSLIINKVESGLPHWLIEVGFALMVVQAICTEQHLSDWIEANGMTIPRSVVSLLGDLILFYGMMQGMKSLRRPYTWLWLTLIVVDLAGSITYIAPESPVNMVLALALPLVYLPLGLSIAYFYRGWLQWVGILMVAHLVTIIIFPIMLDAFVPYIMTDIVAILTLIAFAWTMRRLLT